MIQKLKDLDVYVRSYGLAMKVFEMTMPLACVLTSYLHRSVRTPTWGKSSLQSLLKMRFLFILFLISIVQLLTSNPSYGQALDEYLQTAAENNPELKAYFNDYLAAMEQVPQVGALPDPELSVGFFLQPMERFMGRQQADVRLMQMFPWFGILRTRKDEAGKMALVRYETFQDAKTRLFYQVKKIWYEMYRLEEEIRITRENLEILKTYERMALIRFQSGGTSTRTNSMQENASMTDQGVISSGSSMGSIGGGMNSPSSKANSTSNKPPSMGANGSAMNASQSGMSDVIRVRLEVNELETRLASLEDAHIPHQAQFNQLLNRDINTEMPIADTLTATALSIERLALLDSITQNNPMLKMLEAEAAAYEVSQKVARLEGSPMLGVGVNYMPFGPRQEDGMSMGGKDMIMPMVSVTLPIYRKKYNAMYKEAKLKQEAVQHRKENTINELATQWSIALRDLDDATRRTQLYQEQTELARQALHLMMTAYTASGQDFEEVLRVQQQLLDYQLKLINAIVDQHVTVATLELLADDELMER